jgi:hypothetical protein
MLATLFISDAEFVRLLDVITRVFETLLLNFHCAENFRVLDAEWEIPIPSVGGKRDYATVQRAW